MRVDELMNDITSAHLQSPAGDQAPDMSPSAQLGGGCDNSAHSRDVETEAWRSYVTPAGHTAIPLRDIKPIGLTAQASAPTPSCQGSHVSPLGLSFSIHQMGEQVSLLGHHQEG